MDLQKRASVGGLNDLTVDDIVCVSADTKDDPFVEAFLKEPVAHIGRKKVVIITPVMVQGHSIFKDVNKFFVFYHGDILPHQEEHQLNQRVGQSDDLEGPVGMYITPGCAGRHDACYENAYDALQKHHPDVDPLITSCRADELCAHNDTQNRHYWLFKRDIENYKMKPYKAPADMSPQAYLDGLKLDYLLHKKNVDEVKHKITSYFKNDTNYERLSEIKKNVLRLLRDILVRKIETCYCVFGVVYFRIISNPMNNLYSL